MALNIRGAYGWVKKIIIAGLIIAVVAAIAIWYIFTEKFTNTTERTAAYTINALNLIREFESGDSLANVKYAEKIIIVDGIVTGKEAVDSTINIKMADDSTGSYIIFAFQKENQAELEQVKVGEKISVKGSCSGGTYSEILETQYINFKRCVLNK